MRLSYAMELVAAAGVGMALTHYRLTDPDYEEVSAVLTGIVRLEGGIDAFFEGVALVGGLGLLVERVRRKSPRIWGPGRWIWALVASYLLLHVVDPICGTVSAHIWDVFRQTSLIEDVLEGLRWRYDRVLLPSVSWFLLALALTTQAARPHLGAQSDGRERAGRVFAVLLISTVLVLKALILLGFQEGTMGGSG
jgi:hypothetical protein